MYGYQSNYPQSYGSLQGYSGYGNYSVSHTMNSGPPPMNGAYGGFGYSAYNTYTGYGGPGGYILGFNCPAIQQMSSSYSIDDQPPPKPLQPPESYYSTQYVQHQLELNMQKYLYNQMGYEVPVPQVQMPDLVDGTGKRIKNENQEQKHPIRLDKKIIDEDVKREIKKIFIDELLRRYKISATLEVAQGTVAPFLKYPEDDIVVEFYRRKRDTDLAGQDWDPEADCEYLNVAMKGAGTTESIITHIVATRCNAQRQKLKEMFKTMYGRDLIEEIKSELSGDYKDAILACFVAPAYFDAKCIKKAIYGLGTDEMALIEILMTRTNQQIKDIRAVYGDVARPNKKTAATLIEKDIEGDTSGNFKKLLIAAAQGNRYEITRKNLENAVEEILNDNDEGTGMFEVNYTKLADERKARRDAQRLYEAGEDRWGTDEETFNLIFATRDFYQLREIYRQYVKIAQADIRHAVDSETSGSYRKGLQAIAQCVMNRPRYFAERLMKSMKGLGTDEETLIRIIASRSEIDMVQIKAEFLELTHKTLYRYITEDTSFNFKKILLALVGKN